MLQKTDYLHPVFHALPALFMIWTFCVVKVTDNGLHQSQLRRLVYPVGRPANAVAGPPVNHFDLFRGYTW